MRLKNILLSAIVLVFTLGLALPCAAQDNTTKKGLVPLELRHRISLSYGDGLGLRSGTSAGLFPGLNSHGVGNMNDLKTIGSFNIDYLYILPSGRWGFGVSAGLTSVTCYPFIGTNLSYSHLLLSIAPRVQCNYFRSKLVELYGAASVGVMMSMTPNSNLWAMAWQLDPIAVRVGTDRIAGFVSVGYGSRGIVGVGLQIGL